MLSIGLGIFGPTGLLALLIMTGAVMRYYWRSPTGSLRWYIRNLRLKQLSAIASLFCIAMAASYGIIQDAWALIYVIIAFKTGTWWLRIAITQRS